MIKIFTDVYNRITSPGSLKTGYSRFYGSGGITISGDNAMTIAAWYRAVTYISSQVAKLPFYIKNSENVIDYDHRLHKLLNVSPNEETTAFMFKMYLLQCALNYGNGFAEIETDRAGRPIALWAIPPGHCIPMRSESGKLYYSVTGVDGYMIDVHPSKIFVTPSFHTLDSIHGMSPVRYAEKTLSTIAGADETAGNLFNNGGIPSGVLKHPKKLSDEAYKRLKESWYEQHGKGRIGISILEEGLDFSPITMDPQLMQFIESRKFGVVEIARFTGVSPIKLFDVSASSFANAEQANLEVSSDVLDSWATALTAQADKKLLQDRKGGYYSYIDTFDLTKGDMKARGTYYKDLMQTGAIAPNEIRDKESMPPYEGGDDKYIAVNNYTPANRVHEVIDSQIKKGKPSPSDEEIEELDKELTRALTKTIRG